MELSFCFGGLAGSRISRYMVRVDIDEVGWAEQHVDFSAVRFPAGKLTAVLFVSKDDAAVVFYLEIVVQRNGVGSATIPKLLNKLVPLFVRLQIQENTPFFRTDDINGILLQPKTGT
jgi:hypothetical protein